LLLEFADRLFDETGQGGAFQVDQFFAIIEDIRKGPRHAGELPDPEVGAVGTAGALKIGRKLAQKGVEHQDREG
jgi:hypothetical protein